MGRSSFLVFVVTLLAFSGCRRGAEPTPISARVEVAPPRAPPPPVASPSAPAAPPGVPISDDHLVGEPRVLGNLTVFPIFAKTEWDVGAFTTLDDALAKKTAIVRERGDGEQGASVGSLVVENKGDTPILVLAGTVVKGGNQDRQIGQDFVIQGNKTVAVDAFCVEHGRWSDERNGVKTNGQFGTLKVLANGAVRGAAQYKGNQGEVWESVGKVNSAHRKSAPSDTLTASLDDGEVAKKRAALARSVEAFLEERPGVVGLAYAVDGKVKGARWFVNRQIFGLHRSTLAQTAAQDALTAATARGDKPAPEGKPLGPEAVKDFVAAVDAARSEEKATGAANVNEYRDSKEAWGARTKVDTMARPIPTATAGAPPAKAEPRRGLTISSDYLAK